MSMRQIKNLNDMMGGAVTERFSATLKTVLANIADPNTDATRKRKIVLELTISPNKDRMTGDYSLSCKPTLAPLSPITATMMFERDDEGNVTATEIGGQLPGQMDIDDIQKPMPGVIDLKSAR